MNIKIINGNMTTSGLPAREDKYKRAEELISAGCDAVFELPVHSVINDAELFSMCSVFAADRLRLTDRFMCYCTQGSTALLESIAMHIFTFEVTRTAEVKRFKAQGLSKWEARKQIVLSRFPEAEKLINDREVIQVLEYMIAIKTVYSYLKPQVIEESDSFVNVSVASSEDFDNKLIARFNELKDGMAKQEFIAYAKDVYSISEAKLNFLEATHEHRFASVSEYMQIAGESAISLTKEDARHMLIRLLLNITWLDNTMFGLYTYVPYVRLVALKDDAMLEKIKERSWITVLDGREGMQDAYICGDFNDAKKVLLEIDSRMDKLLNTF